VILNTLVRVLASFPFVVVIARVSPLYCPESGAMTGTPGIALCGRRPRLFATWMCSRCARARCLRCRHSRCLPSVRGGFDRKLTTARASVGAIGGRDNAWRTGWEARAEGATGAAPGHADNRPSNVRAAAISRARRGLRDSLSFPSRPTEVLRVGGARWQHGPSLRTCCAGRGTATFEVAFAPC